MTSHLVAIHSSGTGEREGRPGPPSTFAACPQLVWPWLQWIHFTQGHHQSGNEQSVADLAQASALAQRDALSSNARHLRLATKLCTARGRGQRQTRGFRNKHQGLRQEIISPVSGKAETRCQPDELAADRQSRLSNSQTSIQSCQ